MKLFKSGIFGKLITAFLPMPCPLCRKDIPARPNAACDECRRKLLLIPPDAGCCPGCGGIMTGALAICDQCMAEPERPWRKAYTLMVYRDYARDAIHRFKFGNAPELARPFGQLMAEKIIENQLNADFLVPVPLDFMRQFSRGYNQSMLLAEAVSKLTGIPGCQPLRRIKRRSKQSGRNRADRHKELAGNFILKSPAAVKDRNILLIDDIFTTGATLHAAAMTLLSGGAASVTVFTLARTPGHALLF